MNNNNKELLVDCMPFQFNKQQLTEAANGNSGPLTVTGILQRANAKNQNQRRYGKEILMREANKYLQLIHERRALGELDHAETSIINLKNVSHNVIEIHWEGDDLVGTVEILTTPSGNILRELFKSGIKLGISSRGLGSVKRSVTEGVDDVQGDYDLLCWDFVSTPSTQGAFMYPQGNINESVNKSISEATYKWQKTQNLIQDILSEIK